ncbi:MAG: DUF805 domain-containing protein [Hyphomonas sp.]
MELYLSPNGRIDQQIYWRAVLTLFGISAAIAILGAFVNPLLGLLGLVFVWPWIAVHVKRFHDAGKTGWLTVALVAVALVLYIILGLALPGLLGVDTAEIEAEMQREMERATSQNDGGAMFSAMMDGARRANQAQLVSSIVSTGIVTGVLGAIMGLLRTEPNDNQHGPGPGGTSELFT